MKLTGCAEVLIIFHIFYYAPVAPLVKHRADERKIMKSNSVRQPLRVLT